MQRLARVLPCLLGALALATHAPRVLAQRMEAAAPAPSITGIVRDTAGKPVQGAKVSILSGGSPSAATDVNGAYALRLHAAGDYRVLARRVGLQPELADVTVGVGGSVSLDFVLERSPAYLPAVEVRDTALVPSKYRFTTRYDAFFTHRATATSGIFLDRTEIERGGGVAHALSQRGGVRATENMGTLAIRLPRCTMGSPAVIVDGVLSNGGVLATIPASSIELIEVYRSVAEMPVEGRGNGCGAIVIYTR